MTSYLLITFLGRLFVLNCYINAPGLSFEVFFPEIEQFLQKNLYATSWLFSSAQQQI